MNRTPFLIILIVINVGFSIYLYIEKSKLETFDYALSTALDRKKDILNRSPATIRLSCKKHNTYAVWCDLLKEIQAYDASQSFDSLQTFIKSVNKPENIEPLFNIPNINSIPPAAQYLTLKEALYNQMLANMNHPMAHWKRNIETRAIITDTQVAGDSLELNISTAILWPNQTNLIKSGFDIVFLKNGKEILPFSYPLYHPGDPTEISIKLTNQLTKEHSIYLYGY